MHEGRTALTRLSRRRFFIAVGAGVLATGHGPGDTFANATAQMYGLIGKLTAEPGKRDELIAILLEGVAGMPGCLSYVVAKDPSNVDDLWITEVWENKERHEASLVLPAVRKAIERGRPLIAQFGPERFETEPVGGHGLAETR